MSAERRRRREERKFKRIFVRYGHAVPNRRGVAQRISTKGLFLMTNVGVYAVGAPIMIEVTGPGETWIVRGVVRHAFKAPPSLASFTMPGMGVEFTDLPEACKTYLESL